ncbi:MAG: TetR/AcrR family transcriptional regulator [Chlorobi bacterium]|nr:TetR/AcrR family transcriptional regulator [Chlorobiota bacterium]
MGKEKEVKARILKYAEVKFAREGFYRTTMDELAKDMKISKKTIYKYFSSKNELLETVLENIISHISKRVKEIALSDLNSAEKLYMLSEFITSRINDISEKWLKDLQSYKPELWEKIEKFRRKTIMKNLDLIVNQGKREDLIIKQPNAIILGIILGSVQTVIQPEFILHNNISMRKAEMITLNIVFNGILTKKGRKLFKNFIERNRNGKN